MGNHRSRSMGSFQTLEKAKEMAFILKLPAGTQSCQYIDFSQAKQISDFYLQNYKIINVSCVKPFNIYTIILMYIFIINQKTLKCRFVKNIYQYNKLKKQKKKYLIHDNNKSYKMLKNKQQSHGIHRKKSMEFH